MSKLGCENNLILGDGSTKKMTTPGVRLVPHVGIMLGHLLRYTRLIYYYVTANKG